ncbi:hypothetical protein ACHWQZ_G011674 [Mnemiopsis leidyi]
MWAELHGKLEAVAATVPAASVYLDNRPVKLPWSTTALKRMRKNKDRAWAEFDIDPTDINFSIAISKQQTFEEEEFKAKIKYEKKITSNLKQNCKAFYAYLRNKRQVKSSIVSLDRGDGTRTDTTAESAEVLATAFSSVFVHEPPGPLPKNESLEVNECVIDDMVIRSSDVKKQLLKLNIFKSSGPDGVHPKLLKSLANDDRFVEAVTQLYVKCSETGILPEIWKSASVVALFKRGSKSDPLNYRPVSLTCILCKVYEKLVREHLLDFLEDRISKHQHGFVKGKSCLSKRGTFGEQMPGQKFWAPKLRDIDPVSCMGYSNVVLLCGINDIKESQIQCESDVADCYTLLKQKIKQIKSLSACTTVFVCQLLPTKDLTLNRKVNDFNRLIHFDLFPSCKDVEYVEGFRQFVCNRVLAAELSMHLDRLGRFDMLHLNRAGARVLASLIKQSIFLRVHGGVDKRRHTGRVNGRLYSNVVATSLHPSGMVDGCQV